MLSGELDKVQLEMLFGDLSCSLNQKGEESGEEMVIFIPPEPRVEPHSLEFFMLELHRSDQKLNRCSLS